MFSFSKLVEDASDYFELVEVGLNVDFEFEQKDKVFLIGDSHMGSIMNDRIISLSDEIPKDNPLTQGKGWDLSSPDKLQISLDSKVAQDFGVKI